MIKYKPIVLALAVGLIFTSCVSKKIVEFDSSLIKKDRKYVVYSSNHDVPVLRMDGVYDLEIPQRKFSKTAKVIAWKIDQSAVLLTFQLSEDSDNKIAAYVEYDLKSHKLRKFRGNWDSYDQQQISKWKHPKRIKVIKYEGR